MSYLDEVNRGMKLLADDPRTIFVGQAMEYLGHAVTKQVMQFPPEKRLEFPVAEEFQAGFCLGLAIEGYIPVCIYPRCNFAILAANQIVNHLDKWNLMHGGDVKVIIKMVAGADKPIHPGYQHIGNYSKAFGELCENIFVYNLDSEDVVYRSYKQVIEDNLSSIIIEDGNLYG